MLRGIFSPEEIARETGLRVPGLLAGLLGTYTIMALFCTGSAIGGILRRGGRAGRRRADGLCSLGSGEARAARWKGSNRLRDAHEGLVSVCP